MSAAAIPATRLLKSPRTWKPCSPRELLVTSTQPVIPPLRFLALGNRSDVRAEICPPGGTLNTDEERGEPPVSNAAMVTDARVKPGFTIAKPAGPALGTDGKYSLVAGTARIVTEKRRAARPESVGTL